MSIARPRRSSISFARRASGKLSDTDMPLDPTPIPDELRGMRIALLVSGGIAAYKIVDLASALTQARCDVRVAMTPSATRFVGPPTFHGVTGNSVLTGLWSAEGSPEPHVFLGDWAQLILVAPATANVIGRIAGGRSDDIVTATLLAARGPVVVAPAMNDAMWIKPAVQENMAILRRRGFTVVEPESGHLASGHEGADRGASVTLITTANHPEHHGVEAQRVDNSAEMLAELRSHLRDADLLLMAAAIGDFRPARAAEHKIRREDTPRLTLELEPIPDLIASLSTDESLAHVFRVAFAAEDSDLDKKAIEKMKRKGVQGIVANDISRLDIGFGSDYNAGVLLFADGSRHELEKATKREMSDRILDLVLPRLNKRG